MAPFLYLPALTTFATAESKKADVGRVLPCIAMQSLSLSLNFRLQHFRPMATVNNEQRTIKEFKIFRYVHVRSRHQEYFRTNTAKVEIEFRGRKRKKAWTKTIDTRRWSF
jgi:hypothetical protein